MPLLLRHLPSFFLYSNFSYFELFLLLSSSLHFLSSPTTLLTWYSISLPRTGKYFRRVFITTKNVYYLRHVLPSVRPSVCPHISAHPPLIDFRYWRLNENVSWNSKFGKFGQDIVDVTWRTKYIFLSPATLNRHKSVFDSDMSVQQWKMDAFYSPIVELDTCTSSVLR